MHYLIAGLIKKESIRLHADFGHIDILPPPGNMAVVICCTSFGALDGSHGRESVLYPKPFKQKLESFMKNILVTLLAFTFFSCSSLAMEKDVQNAGQPCLGNSNLPANLENKFEPMEDKALLLEALGSPDKGKLCQGRVYKSNQDSEVTVFRAWNSTNPNSKFGNWWAFDLPAGKVSEYRSAYEICYQWSPLDKLVRCTLKPGVKIVVGTGQSAECSEYLRYPVSDRQQVFIEDTSASVTGCIEFDGYFNWR